MYLSKKNLALAINGILSAAILSTTIPVYAAEDTESKRADDTIIVTTQKRPQNIQDVSVAVTAFMGEDMRKLNMTDSVDIAAQTPGLNIGTPVGEGITLQLAFEVLG